MMHFLKWLFNWRYHKVSRKVTTKKFKDFERYYEVENKRNGIWDSHENLLIKYILRTKLSPFEGDKNLQIAKEFLKEQGVKIL